MSLGERLAAASNRFYLAIRHPGAFEAAEEEAEAGDLSALRGQKYCLLTTFRRGGEGVPTPVWFGLDEDGRAYVRSERDVGKVKRIRNDPRVTVAPCTLRGKPVGPVVEARARILAPDEEERAESAIRANYGLGRRIYESGGERMGIDLVYLEISPASPAAEASAAEKANA